MKTITKGQPVYSFSKNHKPIATIQSGERFKIETYDCFGDQLTSEQQALDGFFEEYDSNPITGPLFIEGAEPGDSLRIDIHAIQLRDWGVISSPENDGIMQNLLQKLSPLHLKTKLFLMNAFNFPLLQ